MPLKFYFDHNVWSSVEHGLIYRRIDVLTAYIDRRRDFPDRAILDRATSLERVLVTMDADFLVEADIRLKARKSFGGIVFAHQNRIRVREMIDDLALIALASEFEDLRDTVVFLPL